jgi:hypothetical protein
VKRLVLLVVVAAACNGDLDPPWQLDHDRIIAVRATPPMVEPGGHATIDGLIAHAGGMTEERGPDFVIVAKPESLASAVSFDGTGWRVTAPAEAELVAARSELKLPANAPVPVVIGVSYANNTLLATKTVVFGPRAENPTLANLTIDGAPAPDAMISVGSLVDVRLSVAKPAMGDVNWLTSCGTMHDFDLPDAYLRVEKEDPTTGELAVVVRDGLGGVAWRVWPIAAHE